MIISIPTALTILQLCLDGAYICIRDTPVPRMVYYEPGTSCYVNGVFHQSCPTPEWKQKVMPKGKPWE